MWRDRALRKLAEMLTETSGKASYGRVLGLVFLMGAFVLSFVSGIISIRNGRSVIDDAASLATTGFALYYGSKHLTLKGEKFAGSTTDALDKVEGP